MNCFVQIVRMNRYVKSLGSQSFSEVIYAGSRADAVSRVSSPSVTLVTRQGPWDLPALVEFELHSGPHDRDTFRREPHPSSRQCYQIAYPHKPHDFLPPLQRAVRRSRPTTWLRSRRRGTHSTLRWTVSTARRRALTTTMFQTQHSRRIGPTKLLFADTSMWPAAIYQAMRPS